MSFDFFGEGIPENAGIKFTPDEEKYPYWNLDFSKAS